MENELIFRAIGRIADRDGDVRVSNTVTEARKVKQGGLITFGVDNTSYGIISKSIAATCQNTHIVVCLIVNAEQLEAEKKLLQQDVKPTGEVTLHTPGKRESGFYWVQIEEGNDYVVAEYSEQFEDFSITGMSRVWCDKEIHHINETRIIPPTEKLS